MKLLNPILKLNPNSAAKSKAAKLVEECRTSESAFSCISYLSSRTSGIVLAYLWLAIEEGYNIIVFSNSESSSRRFVDALCNFVPAYKTAIDARLNGRKLDVRLNYSTLMYPSNQSMQVRLDAVQNAAPDRVMIDNTGKGLDRLFSASKYGMSFICTINGFPVGQSIIKMLLSRRFKVKQNNIHMLDISVVLEGNEKDYSIRSITEYRWASRAEIRVTDNRVLAKAYENSHIFMKGFADSSNTGSIMNSKVTRNYAYHNLLEEDELAFELDRRVKFLTDMASKCEKTYGNDCMQMYYAIK